MRRRLALAVAFGSLLALAPVLAGPAAGADQTPPPSEPPSQIEYLGPSTARGPRPVGVEDDVYCSGWLGDLDEKFVGKLISAENIDVQRSFQAGDVVYVDVGTLQGIAPGQEFWVVRPGHVVNRWGSLLEAAGRMYHTPARIRIVCAQEDTAIAEITNSCYETSMGDLILPFEPIPIPLARTARMLTQCDPPTGKVTGRIIEVKDRAVPIGEDTVVYLDLGEEEGLVPGDFLTVYRARNDIATLRTILGEVAILSTRPHTCVAKVVRMRDVMGAGDQVELK